MKITFGLALDGYRPTTSTFNHLHCGPLGLMDVLELRMGLAGESKGGATRVAQYLKVLEEVSETATRFFSRSLIVDRWGTAATLLRMRDTLRMAGWDGGSVESAPERLRAFSEVESSCHERLAGGLADRIEALRACIASRPRALPEIECIDDAEHLPWLLRRLLEDIGARFACEASYEAAPSKTNLRIVQDHLKGVDVSGQRWNPDDDSIIFANAFSEITLTHAAARLLADGRDDSLLLSTSPNGGILADALRIVQSPVPSLDSPSNLRPIIQVLGLALEMRWEPPDPATILNFLTHPICPVSGWLRRRLAEAVAERPGIGSSLWHAAIERQREMIQSQPDAIPEEISKGLERIDHDLADWIQIERYPRQPGAPGVALAETARRVNEWARKMAGVSQDAVTSRHFAALSSASGELATILADIPNVSPEELTIIREQVIGSGTVAGDQIAELGSVGFLREPGALIEPAGSIVWWGFEAISPRLPMDWTHTEREFLCNAGVHLETPEAILALSQAAARRPFLAARQKVVLLWPRQRALEQVEPHPILTLLRSAFPSIPIWDLDRDGVPAATSQAKIPRLVIPLPAKKRWLHIAPSGILNSRPEESFSSINKLIYHPYEWVFNYPARLRRAKLMKINLMTQRGNLLHRVVEYLLAGDCTIDWRNVEEPQFESWLEALWHKILETEGANYLLPGSLTEGRRLLEVARNATWRLIGHLRIADVASAEADVHMKPIAMGDTTISGIIDLLAKNRQGHSAVMDLKYGQGKAKYSELANNTALQLAVYSQMVREQNGGGKWPANAYFILRSSELLAQDSTFFPDAKLVKPNTDSSGPDSTWHDFLDVWRWRRGQLDTGWIEIPVKGTAPTDGDALCPSSAPPHDKWRADENAVRYDDYKFLTGWEETL